MERERIGRDDEEARRSYRRHKKPDIDLRTIRAAVTNNNAAILADIDQRGAYVRRFRDVVRAYEADLGGDDATLSQGQLALCRRVGMVQLLLEVLESRFIARLEEGQDLYGSRRLDDYRLFTKLNAQLVEALGLAAGRKARDVTPPSDEDPVVANTRKILEHIARSA